MILVTRLRFSILQSKNLSIRKGHFGEVPKDKISSNVCYITCNLCTKKNLIYAKSGPGTLNWKSICLGFLLFSISIIMVGIILKAVFQDVGEQSKAGLQSGD